MARAHETEAAMKEAEKALKPWVIRHLKPRHMLIKGKLIDRRRRIEGAGIIAGEKAGAGIVVEGNTRLPFLLAARTVALTRKGRAVYAEGLASSYEAFLDTRKNKKTSVDEDIDGFPSEAVQRADWYVKSIGEALETRYSKGGLGSHPKITATTKKVIELWTKGEKVLVFCHYIETGRALRLSISRALAAKVRELAQEKMPEIILSKIEGRLKSLGNKFFVKDGEVCARFDITIEKYLSKYADALSGKEKEDLAESFRRFIRTPSFLVRYFNLSGGIKPEDIITAFKSSHSSSMSLRVLIEDFLDFIARRCNTVERAEYIKAIKKVNTGNHRVSLEELLPGENQDGEVLANVRLVNGNTPQETRRTLMSTFNTPFYPEVLIASSVLAEGVDLHLNCRYVIHHDLCWNPSTLEQRTGRIDRINAKAERCGKPIEIYLPYIAGTQDEKMYRVVMDRERWFKVVMGEEYEPDGLTVERIAERQPIPQTLVDRLMFKLDVASSSKPRK